MRCATAAAIGMGAVVVVVVGTVHVRPGKGRPTDSLCCVLLETNVVSSQGVGGFAAGNRDNSILVPLRAINNEILRVRVARVLARADLLLTANVNVCSPTGRLAEYLRNWRQSASWWLACLLACLLGDDACGQSSFIEPELSCSNEDDTIITSSYVAGRNY